MILLSWAIILRFRTPISGLESIPRDVGLRINKIIGSWNKSQKPACVVCTKEIGANLIIGSESTAYEGIFRCRKCKV